jgi:hypothetical protein
VRHYVDEFVPRPRLQAQRDQQAEDFGRAVRGRPGAQTLPVRLLGMNPASYSDVGRLMALQQAAGNRAVVQLLRADSAVSTLQRCGPGGCADSGKEQDEEAPAAAHEARAAAQGVEGQEEEFPEPGQGVVQRTVAEPARPPTVQRVAIFSPGPVHQVNSLADCVVNGTPAGVTWPSLNGTQFWSVAAVQGALVRPTVTTSAVAAGGFEAQVDTVPRNTGSYDETVLARGPWRLVTAKATIGAMLPALATCAAGAGNTRFRAMGKPSDGAMFAANRRHENHHAKDHKAAFRATIKRWDGRLTRAKARRRRFQGATAAAAEAALWTAMGGTPDEVGEAFMNRCQAAVIAYHGSARGGPIGAPTSPGSRSNCDISWAKYRNPS